MERLPELTVRVEEREDDQRVVLAPGTGWWSGIPALDSQTVGGQPIGTLRRLNRKFRLLLPAGASGRISGGLPSSRTVAVEYGQPLFRLSASGIEAVPGQQVSSKGAAAGAGSGHVVTAPTAGVFYRRPSPGAAAFVEVGRTIRRGQPVGLVEVMKTFHQILFDGAGFPDQGVVLEVRCEDAEEVSAGQPLAIVGDVPGREP